MDTKKLNLDDKTIKALNIWHYMTTPHNHESKWSHNEVQWEKQYDEKGKLKVDCYGRPKLFPAYYSVYKCSLCHEEEKTCLN